MANRQYIPTYLYIKQHSITGKLYFGKSTKPLNKMLQYKGSGSHWKSHIKKYGKEYVITLWYQLYDNIFDLVADALSMSKSFDIVNNKSWLNIIRENGLDGSNAGEYHHLFGTNHKPETIDRLIKSQNARDISTFVRGEAHGHYGKTGEKSHNYGLKRSLETKEKLSLIFSGEGSYNFGKNLTKDTKRKISENNTVYYNFLCGDILYKNISTHEFAFLLNYSYETARRTFGKSLPYKNFIRIDVGKT